MAYHSRLREARERLRGAGEPPRGGPTGPEEGPQCGPRERPDFKTFFEDLGTVFQQAEKLMKAGLAQGELESAKLSLRNVYAELGHAVGTLWEEHPDERLGLDHPALAKHLDRICELQERIATLRTKVDELKREGGKP
jgi:hypothetical protein